MTAAVFYVQLPKTATQLYLFQRLSCVYGFNNLKFLKSIIRPEPYMTDIIGIISNDTVAALEVFL